MVASAPATARIPAMPRRKVFVIMAAILALLLGSVHHAVAVQMRRANHAGGGAAGHLGESGSRAAHATTAGSAAGDWYRCGSRDRIRKRGSRCARDRAL